MKTFLNLTLFISLFIFSFINSIKTSDDLKKVRTKLMYSYDLSDFTEITYAKSIHDQPLPFRLPFFGFNYHYIWITRDGYLSFNKGMLSYKFPIKLPILPRDQLLEEDPSLIAPWFALQDIPTEVPKAGIYLKIVNLESELNQTLRARLEADFREGMVGSENFKPKFAIIITWRNMTMVNRRPEMPLLTNTYQCVLATDEIRTYAMFNYEQIQWITHQDNYEGLKGSAAFVGFNAGNTTLSYEFKPYSQNPRISYLTTRGKGNNLPGRYFFQVDEKVAPGACIEKDLDPNMPNRLPLTAFPTNIHMLGGTLVNVTGPCLKPNSNIVCKFGNWRTIGIYRDSNKATCISPPLMGTGYTDLTLTVDDRTNFITQLLILPPDQSNRVSTSGVEVYNDRNISLKSESLEIHWRGNRLFWNQNSLVTLSVWGYKPESDIYPKLTYIDTIKTPTPLKLGRNGVTIDVIKAFQNISHSNHSDITFGFISINLTDPSIIGKNVKQSPILWSAPLPLDWYFRSQWEEEFGSNGKWEQHFCDQWVRKETNEPKVNASVTPCPTTLTQAMLDRGRFVDDSECNVIDRKCVGFHTGALHCVNSGRPLKSGFGQTCCYDDYNELILSSDTIYAGRPSRAPGSGRHPYKSQLSIPVLSEWQNEKIPFLMCCKWQSKGYDSESCQKFNQLRPSDDGTAYKAPVVASVYGDPHFITFDGLNYTFNGRGEYTLLNASNLEVQGRFEQLPKHRRTDPSINATQLTAVAARDNQSSTVEFRLRPSAAQWRYRLYVIVDKEYIFWSDDTTRVQTFKGLTLYQPQGIMNMSHIIAVFDSGAGLEVKAYGGQLSVTVFVHNIFRNKTAGLLGRYSDTTKDDFTLRNGNVIPVHSSMDDIHSKFGQSWRVTQYQSLFFHDSIPYSYYDRPDFKPELQNPPKLPAWAEYLRPEMESICSNDSIACQFDYIMTFDKNYAKTSKEYESESLFVSQQLKHRYIRCPALPKPVNGLKSESRNWPGTIVRFGCQKGYNMTGGLEARRCNELGHWDVFETEGKEPKCTQIKGL